jgi:hypothetical protein
LQFLLGLILLTMAGDLSFSQDAQLLSQYSVGETAYVGEPESTRLGN